MEDNLNELTRRNIYAIVYLCVKGIAHQKIQMCIFTHYKKKIKSGQESATSTNVQIFNILI